MKDERVSKHFKRSELACRCCGLYNIQPQLLSFLEELREEVGFPLSPNSGSRCAKRNAAEGGSKTSAHLRGLAVDISCIDSGLRNKLLKAAVRAGVRGIGLGKTFLHFDLMERETGDTCWFY